MQTIIIGIKFRFRSLGGHMSRYAASALAAALSLVVAAPAAMAEQEVKLVIKDHRFQPDNVTVPTGERLVLVVENQDASPEEFESHGLRVEKIIPGGTTAKIRVGPLDKGEYEFFGEFHEDTAKGRLKAE
jgi:plastocyanin